MKKIILIFGGILFLTITLKAQEVINPNRISIGPRLGFSNSTFAMDDFNTKPRLTPTLGLMFLYSRQETFGIGADLMYTPMGANIQIPSNGHTTELSTQLHYLHLPVQAFYFFNLGQNFHPKVGIGPYVSLLLNSSEKFQGNNVQTAREFETWDYGLIGTLGFNYLLTSRFWLNTDFRYAHGFANVNSSNVNGTTIKNRNISATVGIGFSLGRLME